MHGMRLRRNSPQERDFGLCETQLEQLELSKVFEQEIPGCDMAANVSFLQATLSTYY